MQSFPLLSVMAFFPLLGIPVILLVPQSKASYAKWLGLVFTLPSLALGVVLYGSYNREFAGVSDPASFQFIERLPWIKTFNIEYFVGIDGLSVTMVLLTVLLCTLCMLASFSIKQSPKGYFSLFLLLETGMLGVFISLDFVLFYVFWEVMLLPMYFLIGVWGGPRRVYAAIKFFLYTLLGSVLMLVAMLAFYYQAEPHTFDLIRLIQSDFSGVTFDMFGRAWDFSKVMFLLLFIGFAVKVPIFPFHTWLPDAHVEAPTAISVILAGVLLKMGTYGLMRISYPILPESAVWFSGALAVLALINIVYGALCAMAQQDLKKMVAYSSISHMGFVLLGMSALTETGMNGAILQMFNHGTITAMLFLLVGVVYERAHHRNIDGFGGLAANMPVYAAFTGFAWFAALGLPSLSSFISELMCLLGAFNAYRTITILSVSGILLGAAYMLWSYQRIFLGPLNERYRGLADISTREVVSLVPLAAIVILVGIYPMPVVSMMQASSKALVSLTTPGV